MPRENGIVEAIDTAIKAPSTPEWGRVLLLCVRDDHTLLHEHIREHNRQQEGVRRVSIGVLTAIAIGAAMYVLSCVLPVVFGG
jgi:hypothetical protein